MSAVRLAERLRAGELSPREAVEAYLGRIEARGDLNAYITVRAEEALAEADAASRRSPRGPLWGVPVAVKDVIDVAGAPTTAASEILRENVAGRDAAVVQGLRAAGAIVLGKLNLHEFAYGALSTSPHFGPVRNPWSPDRVCGGSSGGSGAAAAAELAAGTLGTDTGGSIRIPAAFCGVTGHRPSVGLVPNDGVVPVSWSFDTVGPVARSAADCSLLLEAIAPRGLAPDPGGEAPRVGLVTSLLEQADPRVAAVVEAGALELGAEPVEAAILRHAGLIQQLVMLPEAAAAHLPWLRTRLGDYGADVRARLLAGLLLPATVYPTGLRARRWLDGEVRQLFERYDLLAAPTMPIVPPLIGEDPVELGGERVPYRLTLIPFNSPWSCLGLPVTSVPCGLVDGLPVGLALVGRRGADGTVLRAAHDFQRATDWHEQRPPGVSDPI